MQFKFDLKSFGLGLIVGSILMLVICATVLFGVGVFLQRRAANVAPKSYAASAFCPAVGDEAVTAVLKPIRQEQGVPALAAALVNSKGLQRLGAVGVRKRDTEIPVALADRWHLGSDTKAMTATLIGRLVEQGKLRWDTSMAEVFPELRSQMHPDFQKVTVLHLLSHRAGLPANLDLARYGGKDVVQLRLKAVREELAKPPKQTPGSSYEYSNLGYIIAGAVVERICGISWEEAIRKEVFEPLAMTSVGFGGTGSPGKIDQPWPHRSNGEPMQKNGPEMDNPPVMGPAGRVHCTVQDWSRFIQDHLRGERGEPALLKAETYHTLHKPPFGGEYALGWLVVERSWAGGMALNHAGDNTMNFANVWIAPKRDFAILVCANQSGDTGFKATDEAVGALIRLNEVKPPAR